MSPEIQASTQHAKADATHSRRKATLLRTAKVICEAGEYLCLIRELSEIGLSLKFLHEAPRETRILLQLTNGLTYPIERVWAGREQAGYRFGNGIDLAEFLNEDAPHGCRPVRLTLSAPAVITDGQRRAKVTLKDLSREGARFESDAIHPCGTILSFEALGLPQRLGEVRWQDGRLFGMQFQHPLTLQQLADASLSLQPMIDRGPDLATAALKRSRAA